jgi:hypothetical protein
MHNEYDRLGANDEDGDTTCHNEAEYHGYAAKGDRSMLMIAELYDALREAGASEEKARGAASAVAQYEDRLNRIERELHLHRWMLGYLVAATTAMLWRLFS